MLRSEKMAQTIINQTTFDTQPDPARSSLLEAAQKEKPLQEELAVSDQDSPGPYEQQLVVEANSQEDPPRPIRERTSIIALILFLVS